jgi:hypothetical protein
VLPVDCVVDEVLDVESGVVLESRRFMVGRSGSSDGVLVVEVWFVVEGVVEDVVVVLESRRFMVGRSESSLVVVVVVPDEAAGLESRVLVVVD